MGLPPKRFQLNRNLAKAKAQLLVLRSWAFYLLTLDLIVFFTGFYLVYFSGSQSIPNQIGLVFSMLMIYILLMVAFAQLTPFVLFIVAIKLSLCFLFIRTFAATSSHIPEISYLIVFAMLTNLALVVLLMAFWCLYLAFMIDFNKYTKINNFSRLFFTLRFSFSKDSIEDKDS